MGSVVSFQPLAAPSVVPILVLIDLQQGLVGLEAAAFESALEKCREAIIHARLAGIPIAYMRQAQNSWMYGGSSFGPWIEGFEPAGMDMIFERSFPSCYANDKFVEALGSRQCSLVIAGFTGEVSCLATVTEGFGRGQHIVYLCDASASRPVNGFSAQDTHRFVSSLTSAYAEVTTTARWISQGKKLTRGNKNGQPFSAQKHIERAELAD